MARLTWQNVSNPDFSGVVDSYRTMSDLLGRATESGIGAIDTFTKARSDAADRAIMQRMLGVQDPTQYDPNAVIGGQGQYASMEMFDKVGSRPATLLANASNSEALERTTYDNDRLIAGNTVLDQNADQVNMARSLAAVGKHGEAVQLLSSIKGLRADQYEGILSDQNSYANDAQTRDIRGQNLTETRYDFGNLVTNDKDRKAALAATTQYMSQYPDATTARAALLKDKDKYTPEAYAQILQNMNAGGYGNLLAPSTLGGGVGVSTGSNPAAAISAAANGGAPLPDAGSQWARSNGLLTNESGGNYSAQNDAVGSGGKKGHFGALQFGQDRLADAKKAGVIPEDMTPEQFMAGGAEVQDKVADWHFADIDAQAKRSGLENSYGKVINGVTINRDSIRAMAHLGGIAGVRRFIDTNGTSNPADANGTRLSDYGARFGGVAGPAPVSNSTAGIVTDLITRGVQEKINQNDATGISGSYAEALKRKSSPQQVAASMVAPGGALEGTNEDYVLDQINKIVNSGKGISPDIAGEMLSRSIGSAGGTLERTARGLADPFNVNPLGEWAFGTNAPVLAGNKRIQSKQLEALINDYSQADTSERAQQNEVALVRAAEADAATANFQNAQSQYQAAATSTDPRVAQLLPQYKAALDKAQLAMRDALSRAKEYQPDWDVTEVPLADIPTVVGMSRGGGGAGGGR